jgi:hypothetical protein
MCALELRVWTGDRKDDSNASASEVSERLGDATELMK